MTDTLKKLLPNDTWIRMAIVPVLVFIAMSADHSYLADFWHHLARGGAIVQEGRLIDHDLFTFTVPGREFQDVNWLTQIAYYGVYQTGGLGLVRVCNALILSVALAWLVILCRRRSGEDCLHFAPGGYCPGLDAAGAKRKTGSLAVAAGVGMAVFLGLWQVLTVRPQTFSLLLFVILYDLLDRARLRPRLLGFAPLILALWANLHGAFPAGIMLIGCFTLAAARQAWREGRLSTDPVLRSLALCLLTSTAATLINPYGWRIYQYVGLTSNVAAVRRIDEWVPPTLDLGIGTAWLISVVVMASLFIVDWVKFRRKPVARELILIAWFLPLACGSVRMVAWWLLVCAPMAVRILADLIPQAGDEFAAKTPTRGTVVSFTLMLLVCVFSLPGLQHWNPLLWPRLARTPTEEHLESLHQRLAGRLGGGNIFSRFEWGEYLSWSFAPAYKVFMDGRIEIYPDDVWESYAAVTQGLPDWERTLDRYGVDALILDAAYHARTGLLAQVSRSPGWEPVYEAGPAILFLRRNPANRPPSISAAPGSARPAGS